MGAGSDKHWVASRFVAEGAGNVRRGFGFRRANARRIEVNFIRSSLQVCAQDEPPIDYSKEGPQVGPNISVPLRFGV